MHTFLVELWGKHSDPYLQAVHLFSGVGAVLSPQVIKHFLAEKEPISQHQNEENRNISIEVQVQQPWNESLTYQNATEEPISFDSDVQQMFIIQGVMFLIAALLHVLCLLFSGCKLEYIIDKDVQEKTKASVGGPLQKNNKPYLFFSISLLCLLTFFSAAEHVFISLIVPFSIKLLDWTRSYASNLISLFWAFLMVSQLATILLLKFFQMKTLLVVSLLLTLFSPLFMICTVKVTSVSLWIGTIVLALGIGNSIGAVISVGKTVTSYTGVLTSLIYATISGAFALTPYFCGYILDNWDPMWFLYICVIFASCALVSVVLFLTVQHLCSPRDEQNGEKEEEEEMNDLNQETVIQRKQSIET